MNTVTQSYIENVQISDIPWHRLTTAYSRATGFPKEIATLGAMESIDAVDEAGKEIALNIEHQSTLWHSTPFALIFYYVLSKKPLKNKGTMKWLVI